MGADEGPPSNRAGPVVEPGSPLVSILLPCFNAAPFLPATLDSLLDQTYRELEILAVDDGSDDGTAQILEEYAARDVRIRVLTNESNHGLIPTLNHAVAEAHGEFIARMDADDLAVPHRIERQLEALLHRPEIDVVASAVDLVLEDGRPYRRRRPVRCVEPAAARFMSLFATPLAHVTIVARAEALKAHPYGTAPDSLHTEDYELFTRMLAAGVAFLNIDEPLVTVRIRSGSVSQRHEAIQIANYVTCARRYLERTLDLRPSAGAHEVLVNRIDRAVTVVSLRAGLRCLDHIEEVYLDREPSAVHEIRGIADEQRIDILLQATLKGRPSVRLAAALLASSYVHRLLSRRARRYLLGKLWQRRFAFSR